MNVKNLGVVCQDKELRWGRKKFRKDEVASGVTVMMTILEIVIEDFIQF